MTDVEPKISEISDESLDSDEDKSQINYNKAKQIYKSMLETLSSLNTELFDHLVHTKSILYDKQQTCLPNLVIVQTYDLPMGILGNYHNNNLFCLSDWIENTDMCAVVSINGVTVPKEEYSKTIKITRKMAAQNIRILMFNILVIRQGVIPHLSNKNNALRYSFESFMEFKQKNKGVVEDNE